MRRWIAHVVFYGPPGSNKCCKKSEQRKGPKKYKGKSTKRTYSLIVIRLNKNGNLMGSRPCDNCLKALIALGVTKVYYSDDSGRIIVEKTKHMQTGHVCSGRQFLIRTGVIKDSA